MAEGGSAENELRHNRRGRLIIDERTEGWLRESYARWLDRRGKPMFGEPLDHGDELGAPRFEAEPEQQEAGAAPAAVDHGNRGADAKESEQQAEEPKAAAEWSPAGCARSATAARATRPGRRSTGARSPTGSRRAAKGRDRRRAGGARLWREDLERLTAEQVRRVAWLLELAAGGKVSQRTLANAITRATRRYDLKRSAEELEAWLRVKADEVGLLGRREAA